MVNKERVRPLKVDLSLVCDHYNMDPSKDFVTSTLIQYKRTRPEFEFDVLISDPQKTEHGSSYASKFVTKYAPLLRNKKSITDQRMIYIAMRPETKNSHWTSAVLMLKRRHPRLFILDSITHFAQNALEELSTCLAEFGGHTYLCCSGVQSDDESCDKFTLDFLIEMSKLNTIFSYLLACRQTSKPGLGLNKITEINYTDLPWQLVRNAQSFTKIENYLKIHPDSKELEEYVHAHTTLRYIKGNEKKVNTGIEIAVL